ncbi:MAG: methylated-DNA--[protein]-cysteine S-methyltransferase [Phycisphaeraceae bacterium]|nr:methylated-DNA--[protein]-cysteine S-methyltransferase [Phycisphaeraceae bacterium]
MSPRTHGAVPSPSNPSAVAIVRTAIGPLRLSATAEGVASVEFDAQATEDPTVHGTDPGAAKVLRAAIDQIERYFKGTLTHFALPLAPVGTDFQKRVWKRLGLIPYGSTTTYGEIARSLGDANASRAVGLANGSNPIPIIVPCHRVIGADGGLTGFGGGIERKKWLIEHERRVASGREGGESLLFSGLAL